MIGRSESDELGQSGPVGSECIKIDVGGVLSPEGSMFVIRDLFNHVQSLMDKFLLNDLQEFVLLKCLSEDIERNLTGVNIILD